MNKTPFSVMLERVADPSRLLTKEDLNGLSNARQPDQALFAERWADIAVERRREIVRRMGEMIEESFEVEFTPLNRLVIHDTDAQVRATALNNLWECEDPTLIEPILELLAEDQSVPVRAAAAGALGKYVLLAEMEELDPGQAEKIRVALLKVIRDKTEDNEVRRRAVESIAFLGGDEVRGVIEDAYNMADDRMQASALLAMGRSLDEYWSGTVLLELANTSADIRLEAARASGDLELKKAVSALVDLLQDPSRPVLLQSIRSLGQIGGPVARQALELVAESEDDEIAQEAEDALAELEFNSSDDWLVYDFNTDAADDDDDLDEFEIIWKNRDQTFND